MRKIIAIAALLMAGPALAGDLQPKREAPAQTLLPTPTASEDTRPWQGPYVGIGVGYGWQDWGKKATCVNALGEPSGHDGVYDGEDNGWSGKEEDCKGSLNIPDDGQGPIKDTYTPSAGGTEEGFFFTGRVGYDFQHSPLVFGPFAEINASFDNDSVAEWYGAAGVRLGYLIDKAVLVYVNGGVEITDYDNISGDTETNGFAGGGMEFLFPGGWSVTGEGRVSFVEETIGGVEIENLYTVRGMLSKRF